MELDNALIKVFNEYKELVTKFVVAINNTNPTDIWEAKISLYFILKTITFSKSQAVLEWLDAFLHWLVFEFNALTLGVDFPWPLSSH